MSQVLQWTQFCALITKRGEPRLLRPIHRRRPGNSAPRGRHRRSCSDAFCRPMSATLQVHRLVLLVIGVGEEHRGQPVEGELAVRLRIGDRRALRRRLRASPNRACRGRACRTARSRACWSTCRGRRARCRGACRSATTAAWRCAPSTDRGRSSDDAPGRLVAGQLVVGAAGRERRGDMLGRQHAGQHRVVAALDARHVDEAGRAADQRAARERRASAPTASRPR